MQDSPLQGVQLQLVSLAYGLPMVSVADGGGCRRSRKKEIRWDAIYYHFRKGRRDGSLEKVWKQSILTVQGDLDFSELNFDDRHTIAKKGGQSVT